MVDFMRQAPLKKALKEKAAKEKAPKEKAPKKAPKEKAVRQKTLPKTEPKRIYKKPRRGKSQDQFMREVNLSQRKETQKTTIKTKSKKIAKKKNQKPEKSQSWWPFSKEIKSKQQELPKSQVKPISSYEQVIVMKNVPPPIPITKEVPIAPPLPSSIPQGKIQEGKIQVPPLNLSELEEINSDLSLQDEKPQAQFLDQNNLLKKEPVQQEKQQKPKSKNKLRRYFPLILLPIIIALALSFGLSDISYQLNQVVTFKTQCDMEKFQTFNCSETKDKESCLGKCTRCSGCQWVSLNYTSILLNRSITLDAQCLNKDVSTGALQEEGCDSIKAKEQYEMNVETNTQVLWSMDITQESAPLCNVNQTARLTDDCKVTKLEIQTEGISWLSCSIVALVVLIVLGAVMKAIVKKKTDEELQQLRDKAPCVIH